MTSSHLAPSGPPTRSVRWLRRAVLAALCVALAATGLPEAATAQESDEVAAARQALTAERQAATSELGQVEAELGEIAAHLTQAEAELVATRESREEAASAKDAAEVAREEPLAVRRAIAIEVYMGGDPASMSLIREVLDANSSIDGIRDRALYTTVVEWADETIERLNGEIADLTAELADLDREIPRLEGEIAELTQGRTERTERRDALRTRIEDLTRQIEALNRSPLTGLPAESPQTRPILIVKIDNVGPARPQFGLNAADIVVEEKVEAGLSRFAALFHSTGSDPVGPVRSARTSDVHIFANLGSPLFAYSGANFGVGSAVASSGMVDVGASARRQHYYRDSGRRAPHNLFTRTSALWASAGGSPPVPIFEYRDDGAPLPAGARPTGGVDVSYGSTTAGFSWNGSGWVRTTDGRPHPDASGAAVAPANVVVRFTDYVPSPVDARSPESVVAGSGELWVLTAGHVVVGRWEQSSSAAPTEWLDSSGKPIELTPGRTWIVMPEPGRASLR